jgi:predicted metal-dependent hydrolase
MKPAPKTPMALFKGRIGRWAAKIGAKPEQVYVQAMRRKWASTSTTGRVCFSRDLLRQSPSFQDFVIAHELLHLVVPNHGALFKSLLSAYLPKSKMARWDKRGALWSCDSR